MYMYVICNIVIYIYIYIRIYIHIDIDPSTRYRLPVRSLLELSGNNANRLDENKHYNSDEQGSPRRARKPCAIPRTNIYNSGSAHRGPPCYTKGARKEQRVLNTYVLFVQNHDLFKLYDQPLTIPMQYPKI